MVDAAPPANETAVDAASVARGLPERIGNWVEQHKIPAVGLLTVAVVFSALLTRYLRYLDATPPEEKLQQALSLLEEPEDLKGLRKARRLAEQVQELEYNDPEFGGGPEYVIGMVAFHEAEAKEDFAKEPYYKMAVKNLQAAERRSLQNEYRPSHAYALGTSLYELGLITARVPLEEAITTYPQNQARVLDMLTEIYLDLQVPEMLEKALGYNSTRMKDGNFTELEQDRAWQQRAEIQLQLNRPDEVENSLNQVSQSGTGERRHQLLLARLLMARDQHGEAIPLLEPLAKRTGLEQIQTRQAQYLLGVCEEALDRGDLALAHYRKTAELYPSTPAGLVSLIRAGTLLRKSGRDEEALEVYQSALKSVESPETYRNRWLSLNDLRTQITDAWTSWIDLHAYDEALKLSYAMPPAFTEVESLRKAAQSNERQAIYTRSLWDAAIDSEKADLQEELLEQWHRSGQAYAKLSDQHPDPDEALEARWTCVKHFTQSQDFAEAQTQLKQYLVHRPKDRMPIALNQKGELLMELDQFPEAAETFQQVIADYPTSPVVYRAKWLLGHCAFEQDQLAEAENIWQDILTSTELSPAALEWRLALFDVGKLMYQSARKEADGLRVVSPQQPLEEETIDSLQKKFQQASQALDLYLRRYPKDEKQPEARYLLAKSYQSEADLLQESLKVAETNNTRQVIQQKRQGLLKQANQHLEELSSQLQPLADAERLNEVSRKFLRRAYFDVPQNLYELGEYNEAITAYNQAANRYPEDPAILLAYLQMSNCFHQLGQPAEAQSMLEQAKVILKQLPEEHFTNTETLSKAEWKTWLDWARQFVTRPPANL